MHVSLLRPRAASQGRSSRRGTRTRRRLHQGPVLPHDGSQAFEEAAGTLAVSVVSGEGEQGEEEGGGRHEARGDWQGVEDKGEQGGYTRGGVGVRGANESLWGDWRGVEDKGERSNDARSRGCNASSPHELSFALRTLVPNDARGSSSNGSSSVCAAPSADEEEEKEEVGDLFKAKKEEETVTHTVTAGV
jgi:hypothetical protein